MDDGKPGSARFQQLRHPSDVADAEWAVLAPLIPPSKRGGNKRWADERALVDGLLYILSTGCQWRAIPKDLPPRSHPAHATTALQSQVRFWDRLLSDQALPRTSSTVPSCKIEPPSMRMTRLHQRRTVGMS